MKNIWKPASEAPYDTMCLFYTIDGNVVQGFIYDGDEKDFGYTHYMPLPLPPASITDTKQAHGELVEFIIGTLEPIEEQEWHGKWRIKQILTRCKKALGE